MVFLYHYTLVDLGGHGVLGCGWIGVDVFFVLSGFLITGILADYRDRSKSLRDFYARRVLRIFPLYYLVLGFAAAYGLLVHAYFHWLQALWLVDLGNYADYLKPFAPDFQFSLNTLVPRTSTVVVSTGHLWSLCIEEQFYLLWPFVVYRVRSNKVLLWLAVSVIVAAPLLRLTLYLTAPANMLRDGLLYRILPTRMDALMIGAVLRLLLAGPHRDWIIARRRMLLLLGTAPVALFFARAIHRYEDTGFNRLGTFSSSLLFTLVDVAAAVVILNLLDDGAMARALRWAPLLWLGEISYGFYLFHELLRDWLQHLAVELHFSTVSAFTVPIGFALTAALAALSFRFVESPFLRLKRYF